MVILLRHASLCSKWWPVSAGEQIDLGVLWLIIHSAIYFIGTPFSLCTLSTLALTLTYVPVDRQQSWAPNLGILVAQTITTGEFKKYVATLVAAITILLVSHPDAICNNDH